MRTLLTIAIAFLCALAQGQSIAIPGSSVEWYSTPSSGGYVAATAQNAGTASLDASPVLSDGSLGAISLWIKMAAGTDLGGPYDIIRNSSAHILIRRNADNTIRVFATNAAGTTVLDATTTGKIAVATGWVNVMVTIDLTQAVQANRIKIFTNNVDAVAVIATATQNATLNYANPNWGMPNNSSPPPSCMAEYYFNVAATIDFAVAGNRAKFNDGASPPNPISLGATGSLPTGSQPAFYLKGSANGWNVNSGSAGNFTLTGSLTTCASSP